MQKILENISLIFKSLKSEKIILYKIFLLINFLVILDVFGVTLIFPIVKILTGDQLPYNLDNFTFINDLFVNKKNIFLISTIFLFFLVYIIKSIFLVWISHNIRKKITFLEISYSKRLLKRYFNIDTIEFLQQNISDLIRNIEMETSKFVNGFISVILTLISEILIIILLFIVLFIIDPTISMISFLTLGSFGLIYILLFKKKLQRLGKERIELDGLVLKQLIENLSLIKEIKIYLLESKFLKKFDELNFLRLNNITLENLLNIIPKIILENIVIIITLIFIASYIHDGTDYNKLIPTLSLFGLSAFKILPSINKIIIGINNLNYHSSTSDLILEELNPKNQSDDISLTQNQIKVDSIRIKNLYFHYDENLVLNDLSVSFGRGKFNVIIGNVGSGKSTLLNIISGFYSPSKGEILINEKPIKSKNDLLRNTGFVQQNTILVDDTIKNNICYGLNPDEVNENEYNNIVKILDLQELNKKYSVKTIGDFGNKLSGGQKQKISVARSLVRKKSVLVLDEATSSLDATAEKDLCNLLKKLSLNILIIFVTHKKSVIDFADNIFEIKNKI